MASEIIKIVDPDNGTANVQNCIISNCENDVAFWNIELHADGMWRIT